MIRVVLDTNIVVSAALQRKGNPSAVMALVSEGLIIPCTSQPILTEYPEVLARARIGVDPLRSAHIQQLLASISILVAPSVAVMIARDPDDNMFLECAEEARADFLITGNTRDFPEQYRTTLIATPPAFMDASGLI